MRQQWHQVNHIQIICTSLQTDTGNHTSTSPLNFFYSPDALSDVQPTASKHWRQHHQQHILLCSPITSHLSFTAPSSRCLLRPPNLPYPLMSLLIPTIYNWPSHFTVPYQKWWAGTPTDGHTHSNDIRKLIVPQTHNKLGDRSFSAAGPRLWNDLPPGLRRPGLSFDSFRRSLKTDLFGNWSA